MINVAIKYLNVTVGTTPVDNLIMNFQIRFKDAVSLDGEPIAAVLNSLPSDPHERQLLLDEFEHYPDARFEIEVLGALAKFTRKPELVREARAMLGLDWRSLIDHPDILSRKDQDLLDDLQDILPIAKTTFAQWVHSASQKGLLDEDVAKRLKANS